MACGDAERLMVKESVKAVDANAGLSMDSSFVRKARYRRPGRQPWQSTRAGASDLRQPLGFEPIDFCGRFGSISTSATHKDPLLKIEIPESRPNIACSPASHAHPPW